MDKRELSLFKFQDDFLEQVKKHRYSVIVAGRRCGKSFLIATAALERAVDYPGDLILIVGITQQNVYQAVWNSLGLVIPREYISKKLMTPHPTITFKNNSKIMLRGVDSPDALRGISPSPGLVCADELSYAKPDTFQNVLQPLSSNRKDAKYILAGTPNYPSDDLHKAYMRGIDDNNPTWYGVSHTCLEVRPDLREQVEEARESLDPVSFRREYMAEYQTVGNLVFYNFNMDKHVTDKVKDFGDYETVHIGVDFNIGIQAAGACAVRNNTIYWIRDFQGATNTTELIEIINEVYPKHEIICYPDASGSARKTSAAQGVTDHSLLREAGFTVMTKKTNPTIKDSVNAVNTKLLTAAGGIGMYFHPRAKNLIKSMTNTVYKNIEGSDDVTINKSGAEHHSDYVRYLTHFLFPIQQNVEIDYSHNI